MPLDDLSSTAAVPGHVASTDGLGRTVAVLFARADSVYKTLPGCEVYDIDRDAVAMLRNAVAKGFQFALCVEAEKSTACLHNTDDGKVCARMLERFARQQRGAEAT